MLQNKKLIKVVLSAISALLIWNLYLKSKEESINNGFGMVEVLSAARDIPPNTQLSASMLTTLKIPEKFIEPDAIMVKIPDQALGRVVGRVTITSILAGSQIMMSNLKIPGPDPTGVSPLLPPGRRAYILRLGNLDVAKLILPGNYIDVIATLSVRQKDGSTTKASSIILQNILVIGVGSILRQPGQDVTAKTQNSEGLTVTLALTPAECSKLALAQTESQGDISVTVRGQGDNTIQQVPITTPQGLLANSVPLPVGAQAPNRR